MINYYLHAGSDNHGCEAIVRSTVGILGGENRLFSLNKEKDFYYGINEICEIESDNFESYKKGSREWLCSRIQTKLTGKIDLAVKYQRKNLFHNMKKGDIFLSIGGDNYCYAGTEELAAVNRNAKKRGAKLVLWGCSVEPDLLQQKEIYEDLKSFDLITTRESISYDALRNINKNTIQVSDPAFTLETRKLQLPEGWLEGNMVGINASPLILKSGKDSKTVYLAYKMLIQEILQKTDYGVALIPHVVCEGNNDLEVLTQLYNEFAGNERIILIGDYNLSLIHI